MRPVRPEDRQRLRVAFERLSAESRRRRFLMPVARLSSRMLTYLTQVDHHDHEALVVVDAATDEGVGIARFVRSSARPDSAEAAVTVADAWQGRGLGTLLVELLAARAREEGITRFTALMLADNDEMRDVLQRVGPVRVVDQQSGTVEVEVELPPDGIGGKLQDLLRLSRAAAARAPHDGGRPPASVDERPAGARLDP